MGWVMAPTRELRQHQFGNVVLSRYPIREHTQLDLSWKTCEPRNSQRVRHRSRRPGDSLHLYNVHLGTALLERRYQAPRLAAWIHDRRVRGPKIVLGDFNEWGRGLRRRRAGRAAAKRRPLPAPASGDARIPGFFPVLHLDHIYFAGDSRSATDRAAADATRARRVGSPAARRRYPRRPVSSSLEVRSCPPPPRLGGSAEASREGGKFEVRRAKSRSAFFEIRLDRRRETRRRTKRFAVIVDRQSADVARRSRTSRTCGRSRR